MRKTTNRSAFTLVELIVVITILAILGTIGFMSIKGYTAEANNAKVTSDLTTIQRGIETKVAEGGSLMAFVAGNDENKLATIKLQGNVATANSGATDALNTYDSGTPNYVALGIKKDEFVDPIGSEYRIAATTTGGGRLEMAGVITIEGTKTAKLKGSYTARDTSTGAIKSTSGRVLVLDGALTNFFRTGDKISLSGGDAETAEIKSVKRDGVTVVLSADLTNTNNDTIALTVAESDGLLSDRGTRNDNVLVNGGSTYLPY